MPADLEAFSKFQAQLNGLIQKYTERRHEYIHESYAEDQLRMDFIDPLIEALGWDIRDIAKLGEGDREVVVERGATNGRPDYAFRIGRNIQFYLEAKAPHVTASKPHSIIQAKKYAYSNASQIVYFAAVTDFEEFMLFDVPRKPDLKKPLVGLVFRHKYTDYLSPKALKELWYLSRTEVSKGSLDRLLRPTSRAARLRSPLDKVFLSDLSQWRVRLAETAFASHPELTAPELNSAVQGFLDRLVFIRVAEDRGVLPPGRLIEIARTWKRERTERPIVADIFPLFKEVNEDLNGEIFKPHSCEALNWSSKLVAEIIEEGLEPYDFAQIGVELLGSIYERYLGQAIYIRDQKIRIEDKPSVRKAGGVYYTPKYVVDFIVKRTVGSLVEGKSPKQIGKLRILDASCGSGSFLLGAYQYLLDVHLRWYEKTKRSEPDLFGWDAGKPRLTITEKARILKNNIFGVDYDPQAVEITMMSLYIKMLEGERGLFHKKGLLPSLSSNIKCGNSLISTDFEDVTGKKASECHIGVFSWKNEFHQITKEGGFNVVLGNPPWGAALSDEERLYLRKSYSDVVDRMVDTYIYFIEQGLRLRRQRGIVSYIVPATLLNQVDTQAIRSRLLERGISLLVNLGQGVFGPRPLNTSAIFVSQAMSPRDQIVLADLSRCSTEEKQKRIGVIQ